MKTKKPRKRVVKGWVLIDGDYNIQRIGTYQISKYEFPCTITYTIPQKKRKK